VKNLISLTLPNPSTLNQAIAQVVWCDNKLFKHQQERHHEPTSTTQKNFAPPITQKNFSPTMPIQPSTTLPKYNPIQIDKTRFKPFMEQKKQCQHTNNLCLYCGELGYVVRECPKKHGPHITRVTSITNSQPKDSKNKHV